MKRILKFILITIIVLLCIIGLVKLFGKGNKKTTTLGKNQVVNVRSKEKIKLSEETKKKTPTTEEKEEVNEEPINEEVVEQPEPEPVKKPLVENNVVSLPNYEEVPVKGSDEVATNQSIIESEEPYSPNGNSNYNYKEENDYSYSDNIYGDRCYNNSLYYITVCQTRETPNAQCKYTKINGINNSGTITRSQIKMAVSCQKKN